MKNTNKFLMTLLLGAGLACQKSEQALSPKTYPIHSASRAQGNGGCQLHTIDDGSIVAFNYHADGSPASAVIDGYDVQYDEVQNGLITKLSYGGAGSPRTISIQYDSHGRPIKAFKTLSVPGFAYTATFTVTYNAQGRLATLVADFDGDQDITMAHRISYSPQGNVLAHYIAENGGMEYVYARFGQYDNHKNTYEALALHPLNLFYEPASMARNLSANNPGRVDFLAENSGYFGTFIAWDDYKYLAYSPQGYPTEVENAFDYNYVDFDFHVIFSYTYLQNYFCPGDSAPGKAAKGAAKASSKSFKARLT